MSSATSIALPDPALAGGQFRFTAMASQVSIQTAAEPTSPLQAANPAAFHAVADLFAGVEAECTRFKAESALMRANAAGDSWAEVPAYCYAAIASAAQAHRETAGLFDPRILNTLQRLGYDRSFPGPGSDQPLAGVLEDQPGPIRSGWQPDFDEAGSRVRIGPEPIDLGGIGKGLAVRWAVPLLRAGYRSFLIEAGGDCYLAGSGPAGNGWQVAIEDPAGGSDPVAVLNLSDRACATSSTRLRSWTASGQRVHHLIDPRTGRPGSGGLTAVTVIADDPAWAEVWSKSLFLLGRDGIAGAAAAHALAAIWIGEDGGLDCSAAAEPLICWRAR
ncbi:MAG: FAD:protein FMN transferase [Jatrophihabitantaceae bacterium]